MKKMLKFLVPLIMVAVIATSVVWYLFIYDRAFTRDTLLSQARFQDEHGNSRLSAWFYDLAYSFSGHDENVAIELANQYKQDGNFSKAELTLTQAIHDMPTAELYTALSKTFVEQDKLLDAVSLLDRVSNEEIRSKLDTLRPSAPVSDFEAGYYSDYMDIHLSSPDAKYIFYTTDGEYPSIEGNLYNTAISLPAGETTIYAISVAENGLVSPVTVLGYTITGVIEEVTFQDEKMEAAIRELVNVGSDRPIYTNQLWEITEFTAPEGVSTYADLAALPYLTTLNIQNQEIDSLASLAALTKLVVLDLSESRFPVNELDVLAGLPSLSSLTLSGCALSTIEGLEGAKNLTYLDLSNNTIRNLDVLPEMTALAEIDLSHNAVTDLSALNTLSNLVKLNVSFNSLTSLEPLGTNVRLNHLDAGNNQISTLSGLQNLLLLNYLDLNHNQLSDVSALATNVELATLDISNNTITDIHALKALTKLEKFAFSSNQVEELPEWPDGSAMTTIDGSYNALTSLDSLKNMQKLSHVYMDYNLITNIDALSDCYCLVQVNVFGNTIEDVSVLRDRDIIVNYNPTAS